MFGEGVFGGGEGVFGVGSLRGRRYDGGIEGGEG